MCVVELLIRDAATDEEVQMATIATTHTATTPS